MAATHIRRWIPFLAVLMLVCALAAFADEAPTLILEGRTTALGFRHTPYRRADAYGNLTPPMAALPPEARQAVDQFEKEHTKALQEVEDRFALKRKELVAQLKALQDRYTKAGQLDEALAIRDHVRQLSIGDGGDADSPLPDPGALSGYREHVGKSFYFMVLGRAEGAVWGSDIYTDDSLLGVAAVHAGLVQPGQQTVVRVTILAGRQSYEAVSRNGITSQAYAQWDGSYSIESANGVKPITADPQRPARAVDRP